MKRRGCVAVALLPAAAAWIATFAGCASDPTEGYAAMSVFPEGVRTVHVPIFENATLVRDVQFDLTDAVIKEIEARTPYSVAAEGRADTALIGTIREVDLNRLSTSPLTGLSEEVILSVTIDFEWRDLRTGRPIIERKDFAGFGLFVPSRPTGEAIEIGRFAAVQQLAKDVVNELQAPW